MHFPRTMSVVGLLILAPLLRAHPQDMDVQAQIKISRPDGQKAAEHHPSSNVVVWLNRVSSDSNAPNDPAPPGHFRIVQKNKSFDPHLLVVPLGSSIEFPNLDPFFHNVFSQFNGKRFDLGLYEAGSTKVVRFDHEGISYLFCNIHPEMGAVIITLSTPYFAVASGGGNVALHNVPDGTYEMHVWAEGADPKQLDSLARRVHIGPSQRDIGVIRLVASGTLPAHKNKFGEDYKPDKSPY